jgi:hypothetical protein
MSSRFDDARDALAPPPEMEHVHPSHVDELASAIRLLQHSVAELVEDSKPAESLVEDLDLTSTANNVVRSQWQSAERYTEAVQVDNPYAVTVELRASRDGGGAVVMRVPAHSSRVLTVRARDLSLRAVAAPAGVIPATLIRFDRPQPAGLYPYAP